MRPDYLADGAKPIVGDVLSRDDLCQALDGISIVFLLATH
jgi:hypothetical protein